MQLKDYLACVFVIRSIRSIPPIRTCHSNFYVLCFMSRILRVFIRQDNDFLHVFEYRAMGLDSSGLIFEWVPWSEHISILNLMFIPFILT